MPKRETISLLGNVLDDESFKIIKILFRGEITDQKIADKLKLRPNTVRRILNEMHTKGIITYRKEKEKSGWYNYIWRINEERLSDFLSSEKQRQGQSLLERLKFEEENHFFKCTEGCVKIEYDNALDSQFKCPICNSQLVHYDNKKEISSIKRELKSINL